MLFSPLPHHCCCPAIPSLKTHLCFLPLPDFLHPTPFLWFLPFSQLPHFLSATSHTGRLLCWHQIFLKSQCQPTVSHPILPIVCPTVIFTGTSLLHWVSCPLSNCAKKQSPSHSSLVNVTQLIPAYSAKKKNFHPFLWARHCDNNLYCTIICDLLFPSKCFLNVCARRCSLSGQENKRESGTVSSHSAVSSLSVVC